MVLEFNELPDSSRVWIYQSNRAFTNEEVNLIEVKMKNFLKSWTRHGDSLNGAAMVKYNQFIVLGIDENTTAASGCSIDASVFFIKELEKEYSVQLLDRMQTSYKQNESIKVVSLAEFNRLVKEDEILEDTVVFNNIVANKAEFDAQWEVPAKLSWHKRYFNSSTKV
ncbi:MAG: ABC transporter ATPase [Flavobacteriaceae bacterium]|nr:MAG: ABC transporter ATPase [Flavobacteriaceae bacterium]